MSGATEIARKLINDRSLVTVAEGRCHRSKHRVFRKADRTNYCTYLPNSFIEPYVTSKEEKLCYIHKSSLKRA